MGMKEEKEMERQTRMEEWKYDEERIRIIEGNGDIQIQLCL